MAKKPDATAKELATWVRSGAMRGYVSTDSFVRPWASYVVRSQRDFVEALVFVREADGAWHLDRSDPSRVIDTMEFLLGAPPLSGILSHVAQAYRELTESGALSRMAAGYLVNQDGVFTSLEEAAEAWVRGRERRMAERAAALSAPRSRVAPQAVQVDLFKTNRRRRRR